MCIVSSICEGRGQAGSSASAHLVEGVIPGNNMSKKFQIKQMRTSFVSLPGVSLCHRKNTKLDVDLVFKAAHFKQNRFVLHLIHFFSLNLSLTDPSLEHEVALFADKNQPLFYRLHAVR